MRKNIAFAAATLLAAGAAVAAGAAWNPDQFGMNGLRWWPAPSGHQPGKDDPAVAMDASHHPGDDCGICHAPAASETAFYQPIARAKVFTITGTIFESRATRQAVPGAELVLLDYAGNTLSVTANDLGNFSTQAPLAADERLPANPSSPSDSWSYKAWVKAEGGIRPMMTIPTVGGMTVPRMSCSMHHVPTGTLGGAWASPRSTLRAYPGAGLSYRKHVFPILRTKCAPCHIPGPTEASRGGEVFDYGAGLDLVTYAGSTVVTTDTAGTSRTWVKRGIRDVVNVSAPESSMLLAKTLEGAVHGGGAFWTTGSADFQALRQWIAEGAQDN
jgi:hypothetical protein